MAISAMRSAISTTRSTPQRDQELVGAIAVGSHRALKELYQSYVPRLTTFVARFARSRETVEEVINDTFLVVWRSAKDFRYASKVSTWIIGIAYRTALKSVRKRQQTSPSESLDYGQDLVADPTADSELRDWLTCGLARLPFEQRLTVELSYRSGHSLEEIARIMDAPVGTVKARMFHARDKLRRCLPMLGGQ